MRTRENAGNHRRGKSWGKTKTTEPTKPIHIRFKDPNFCFLLLAIIFHQFPKDEFINSTRTVKFALILNIFLPVNYFYVCKWNKPSDV
jgi:hypothetical protein